MSAGSACADGSVSKPRRCAWAGQYAWLVSAPAELSGAEMCQLSAAARYQPSAPGRAEGSGSRGGVGHLLGAERQLGFGENRQLSLEGHIDDRIREHLEVLIA